MNKKVFNIFIVILAIVGIAYFATNQEQTDTTSTNKTLVIYFSAQSHTKEEAKGGNWQEGERFPSNASNDATKSFTDRIQ